MEVYRVYCCPSSRLKGCVHPGRNRRHPSVAGRQSGKQEDKGERGGRREWGSKEEKGTERSGRNREERKGEKGKKKGNRSLHFGRSLLQT